jgi:GntR family transcriptional regulator, transcriptional repressor for pyruvate dehydrogenase complex
VLPVREAEIAQQLRRHKSDDLRDLIDLAAATAGSAARLASRRSDEQDVRMPGFTSALASPPSPAALPPC